VPAREELLKVADVVLDARSGGTEARYTYLAGDAELGQARFVPLGGRSTLGFVFRIRDVTPEELGFDPGRLRPLGPRIVGAEIPPPTLDLLERIASDTLTPLPTVLSLAIAPGARQRIVTEWRLIPNAETGLPLSAAQGEALAVLRESKGRLLEAAGKPLAAGAKKALRHLVSKGLVAQAMALDLRPDRRRLPGLYRLIAEEARVDRFLVEAKRKPAQSKAVLMLQGAGPIQFTASEIKALSDVTDQTIRALAQAGILEQVDENRMPERGHPPQPNRAQQQAIDAITEGVRARRFEPFLLFGITGSGKTEVYLRSAEEALLEGRQVLYLVPEIALTAQAIGQLRSRFGAAVVVLHSSLPPSERLENWSRIKAGTASVVLGTRSAIFAPFRDLGLIVMDEEHEAGYKQESAPRYHAKAPTRFLARRFGCPIVLGSATPSIETYFEAEKGHWQLLELRERAAHATLPSVAIEDMRPLFKVGRPALFCETLLDAIDETLAREEQVILFLNRRAFSASLMCRECGHSFRCPSCAVTLSYHRRDAKLRCHHCGYQENAPDVCPACGGTKVAPMGAGVEKVEDQIKVLFPDASVARLDRDIARKRGALEETIALFRGGEIDILVGTQMIAKGLDFPRVTLVGVIAADLALSIPDFRSSERTFQLLSQVAGRAGRGDRPGHVVIQTFSPDNIAVRTAREHDFSALYRELRAEREQALYPPFVRLVNLVFAGENRSATLRASQEALARLEEGLSATNAVLLGPVDCALERLQNKWRRHILIKLRRHDQVHLVGRALGDAEWKGVQFTIDVDPYSLL